MNILEATFHRFCRLKLSLSKMVQIGELAGLAVGSTVLLNVMFAGYCINLSSNLIDFNTALGKMEMSCDNY